MRKNRMMNFNGSRMRELRKAKNLTVNDLYRTCCIKWYRFDYFESGRGYPTVEEVGKIAKALGVPIEELLH